MKKDVILILVAMLAVFSICACSVCSKELTGEKLSVQEKLEKNYINTAKESTKQLGCQTLRCLRAALGVRGLRAGAVVKTSKAYFAELAGAVFYNIENNLDFLYQGFCMYSPFSLFF